MKTRTKGSQSGQWQRPERLRVAGAVGVGGGGGGGLGTHWKPLNTSNSLQGRPSEDNGRGAVGAVREGGDDVEWVGKALRTKRRGLWGSEGGGGGGGDGGGGGLGRHWKPLNTSKGRENPNQGQPGRDNGRDPNDVEWLGRRGFGHTLEALKYF